MARRWRESGDEDPAGMPYGAPELPPGVPNAEGEGTDEQS
jgi:hypothetical protein